MLRLRTRHAIGIQILVASRLTYALVLLTANLEDVKKIARQFVEDSVADQIAHFLVQAGVTQSTNISEENEQNDNINEISDDEWNIHHPQQLSEDDNASSDTINRVKTRKERVETTTEKIRRKIKLAPSKTVKEFNGLNLKPLNIKTTSGYTYDLILTQDYKQTPKFEWKKEVNFDFVPTQSLDVPKTYYYDTIKSPVEEKRADEDFQKNVNPIKLIDKLKLKHSERAAANINLIKKKKTLDANKILRIDELKREIVEKLESRLNEIGSNLKSVTFKRPEPNFESFKYPSPKSDDSILEKEELEPERTGSTKLRGQSGEDATSKYAVDIDYKDSIYVKKEIVATSGPVQLYKQRPAASRVRQKDSLEDLLSRDVEDNYEREHKRIDDNLYFKRHLEKLFRRHDDANNTTNVNTTSIYANGLDDDISIDELKNNKLDDEEDEITETSTKKDDRKGKDTIEDEVPSKEDNEYRRMKIEETAPKEYNYNADYKPSVSYGDYR